MCVEAGIALKDGRAATVLISVGTSKGSAVAVPAVYDVRVTGPGGTVHRLDRLSDLPVELHRPLPKGPKDLPAGLERSIEPSLVDIPRFRRSWAHPTGISYPNARSGAQRGAL